MLAICHLCYFMEFDSDDYVNQTINLPQSIMNTTPQNYFSESFFLYCKDYLLFTLQGKVYCKTRNSFWMESYLFYPEI